ncbi:hypothetical protein IV102_01545 [bacterium]|nr:hypothetical protein [bacterium]
MQISNQTLVQSRPLNSAEGQLAGSLIRSSRLQDGYVGQLQTDITAFPTPWLQRFQDEHLAVAVLKDDQTLADTPILHTLEDSEIDEIVTKGRPLVEKAVAEIFGPLRGQADEDYQKYGAAPDLQTRLHEISNQELGFTVAIGRDPQHLEYLAETLGFDPKLDPDGFARWSQAFLDINQGLLEHTGEQVRPRDGIYVVPYVNYRGKNVRAMTLPSYQAITGLDFQQNLGANYPENRLVILHDSVVPNPSPRSGKHRVVLHELGHAVDWICKELPQTRETHEKKVEELFQLARKREAQGQTPFLTDRARDSSGEMMAEAVEAYLTRPEPDSFYKPENFRENLSEKFPELYNYVDYLINLE